MGVCVWGGGEERDERVNNFGINAFFVCFLFRKVALTLRKLKRKANINKDKEIHRYKAS